MRAKVGCADFPDLEFSAFADAVCFRHCGWFLAVPLLISRKRPLQPNIRSLIRAAPCCTQKEHSFWSFHTASTLSNLGCKCRKTTRHHSAFRNCIRLSRRSVSRDVTKRCMFRLPLVTCDGRFLVLLPRRTTKARFLVDCFKFRPKDQHISGQYVPFEI